MADTGSLPKVEFADKTDKPVELKSVAVELPPKEKKRVGRPKQAPKQEKEKEKVEQALQIVGMADAPVLIVDPEIKKAPEPTAEEMDFPECARGSIFAVQPQIKEAIPAIDNKEYINQLHEEHKVLAQEKADLEYELQCMQANFQALDQARVTQLQKHQEGTVLAVHISIIVGGIIGGACSAGALALIKMFI